MAKTIEAHATVPLATPILLSHFYQYKIDQFPVLRKENLSIRLWFDTECINCNPSMPSEDRLRVRPMMISQFKAHIQLHEVTDRFADFVLLPTEQQLFEPALCEQYVQFTEQIYDFMFGLSNRVLSFVRAHQWQFWVEELRLEDRKDLRPILAGYAHVAKIKAKLASLRHLLVSLSSRARTSKEIGFTVLLAFDSRRLRVFVDLLYIESLSPEIERAERVNALPCRFLKH
ncbi:MAG TPA: hypothetical protein V6C97_01880 [Oculatellaceae cyanobacterium]